MGEKVKKRKHFISTLGTSVYAEGKYIFGTSSMRTKFVQQASLEIGMKDVEADAITICLTECAEKKNWLTREYTQNDIEMEKKSYPDTKIVVGDKYQGLKEILEQKYAGRIHTVRMVEGSSQEETDQMFQNLYDIMEENDEIYLDITHGFRFFPMLAMTVLEYAKVTKNITVGGIYYGMFGRREPDKEVIECPLLDLTYYSDILDWSNAADSFVRYGNSRQIRDLMQPMMRKDYVKYGKLNSLVKALNDITSCIDTGRGKNGGKNTNSVQIACVKYQEQYDKLEKKDFADVKPLEVLMEQIDQKVNDLKVDNNLTTGLSVIKWSIDNDMIQQGYTALEETIKTYVCALAGVEDTSERYRDYFSKNIINKLNIEKQKGIKDRSVWYRAWLEEMEERKSFEKFYEGSTESQEVVKERVKRQAEDLIKIVPNDLLKISNSVSQKRNDINHFGFNETPVNYEKFKSELEKRFNDLLEIIRENPVPAQEE